MSQKKVYGLILPKKGGPAKGNKTTTSAFNVFGDDSDQEETQNVKTGPYGTGKATSKMKRQTQMDIDKALQEDPNVYEYDDIYDEMQAQKPKVGLKEKEVPARDRKPKYIVGLLKAAEVKKKDDERRKERQVQKEREAEGSKFADKESFVTSAYKKKMLEMQAEEEKERREAEMEALTDVTKQKDMSGFYRYLYRQTTTGETDVKQEPTSKGETKEETPSQRVKTESPESSLPKVKEEQMSPAPHRRTGSNSSSSSSGSESSDSDADAKAAEMSQKRAKPPKHQPQTSSQSRKVRSDSPTEQVQSAGPPDPRPRHEASKPKHHHSRSSSTSSPRQNDNKKMSGDEKVKRRHDSSDSDSENDRREKRRRDSSDGDSDSDISGDRALDKKQERSRRSEEERGKDLQKRQSQANGGTESNKKLTADMDSDDSEGVNSNTIDHNLREIRKESNVSEVKDGKENKAPSKVDPAKKVYPHHNSPKDIEEARKRYLQRKLARERAKFA